ncbi:hypothetical protein ACQ4PT_011274 [Festuca glaucescens]
MASRTPTHVSATPGDTSLTLGTAEKHWLGDLESPLSSASGDSSGCSFAEKIRCAWAAPVEASGTSRRRFVASPVRFPNPSPPRRPAAASPVRYPSPPPVAVDALESSRRMAARRPGPAPYASAARAAPRVDDDGFEQPHGRYYRRNNRRSASPPSPPPPAPPARPVPADLWGLCFNCCRPGHKVVDCWYPSRCLRCHEEGHRAADIAICLRGHSPPAMEASRPAQRRHEASPLHPSQPQPQHAPAPVAERSGASVLGGRVQNGMTGGSASAPTTSPPVYAAAPSQVISFSRASSSAQHAPPSIEELMQHRPGRTLYYVHRSPAITEAESALADPVTIMIVGSRPEVSRAQLAEFISSRFDIASDLFDVYDFAPEDFLLHFSNNADRNRVLATAGILSAPSFKCTIKPWIRQAHARASSCHYRVVVDILGMPANASCLDTASAILAPCSVFERVLTDRFDRSRFRVAAWTLDPTTIPFASILFVEEPSVNAAGDDTELKLLSYDITIKDLVRPNLLDAPISQQLDSHVPGQAQLPVLESGPCFARRHLNFDSPALIVYSRRAKNRQAPPPATTTRAALSKAMTSPTRHLLPRPAVRKRSRKEIPKDFIPRQSWRVAARGDGRPGDSMRSCLKVILKKLGIPVEENQGAPPSAAIESLLADLPGSRGACRTSLYADDTVIFFKPTQSDCEIVKELLRIFGEATGLHTNILKSAATPIRCGDNDRQIVADHLVCPIKEFPITYLGVPLSIYKLCAQDLQPLINNLHHKLSGWHANLLSKGDRLVLVKAVLAAVPIHAMLATEIPKPIGEAIIKCQQNFFWSSGRHDGGGSCAIAWHDVCRPIEMGGLGVLDLKRMSWALRARWSWLQRVDPGKPWAMFPIKVNRHINALIHATTSVKLGDGTRIYF